MDRARPAVSALFLRVALAIVRGALWLVPAWHRSAWQRQWEADLWARARYLERSSAGTGAWLDLVARALGVFRHALWLRSREWSLEMILQDLRYGVRLLLRRPAFTAVAVLVLAIGIGANATIFSWTEALVLRPLPGVQDADRLVVLHSTLQQRRDLSLSYPNFRDLRRDLPPGIQGILCHRLEPVTLRAGTSAERAWATLVSGNYFEVLGLTPVVGRAFRAEEDATPGTHPVVVLSHRFWQRRFDARPDIVGQTVMLNERAFTVIGVAPERFQGTSVGVSSDLFVPMMMHASVLGSDRLDRRGHGWLKSLVRLAPSTSLAQAASAFDVAARRLQDHPENRGRGFALYPMWRAPSEASGMMAPVLAVLMVVVGLVLLVACANLAGLLLARASAREREIAMRLALGAGRMRLVRQLVTENLVLAALGGVAGLVIATWTARLLTVFLPPTRIPLLVDASLSPRVLAFAAAITMLTGLVFGLTPALQSARTSLVPALKGVSGRTTRRSLLRKGLVVAQVALSLLLLVTAGLFLRTVNHARSMDVGFSLRQGMFASVDLVAAGFDDARMASFYRDLSARARSVPGVRHASLANNLPLSLGGSDMFVEIEGYARAKDEDIDIYYAQVGDDYFRTMGIPLIEGRPITERDTSDRPAVVVVNEAMARRYWKDGRAIGGKVRVGKGWAEVVGIAKTGKYLQLAESPRPFMYLSLYQFEDPSVVLHVETERDPLLVAPAIAQAVRGLDARVPVFDVTTIAEHMELSLFMQRMAATLLGFFGGVALLLAGTGLYGVLAYLAAQRTREIGIRMALGADRRSVVGMIVRQGVGVASTGLVLGLVLTVIATRALASQLIGVEPLDALSIAGTLTVLGATAFVASFLPARRAAGKDPLEALREE